MKKLFAPLAIAAVLGFGLITPALSEDIDIGLASSTWDVDQDAIALAIANGTAVAEGVNANGIISLETWNSDDVALVLASTDIDQLAVAGSLSLTSWATADATNASGIVTADIKEVLSEMADITGSLSSGGAIDQEAWAVALAATNAAANAVNAHGVIDVSVDVD